MSIFSGIKIAYTILITLLINWNLVMTLKKLTSLSFVFISFFSASIYAHGDQDISCNTNITSDIIFTDNQLRVKSNEDEDILFTPSGVVQVDGKEISLSNEERKLAQKYFTEVEATIPLVVEITVEAIEITNLALTEVFTGLLSEDSKLPSMINGRLNKLADDIRAHVYKDPDSLTFNSSYLKEDLGIGEDMDAELEAIVDEITASVIGEIMISLGKAMLSGDGDFSDFEDRMDNLGRDIDQKAEVLGKRIEEKSEVLCAKIKDLDHIESQLSQIQELRNLNTIHFNKA